MTKMHSRMQVRETLDARLEPWMHLRDETPPGRGWMREIREAIHMSSRQLARRMKMTQPAVTAFEQAELRGVIRLATLRKAAEALNCNLVYAFVPKDQSLNEMVRQRARAVAAIDMLETMQRLDLKPRRRLLNYLARDHALTIEANRLWDEQEVALPVGKSRQRTGGKPLVYKVNS